MEVTYSYKNLIERKIKVAEGEALGLTMLHDTFDPDWKKGDEPHGTLIFTDVRPPVATEPVYRDYGAELDELKAEVMELKRI